MDWIRYRIEDAKANRSPVLDLGLPYWALGKEDRLTALPSDVLEMDWLEELDLSGHALTALPPGIGALSRLSRLNLSGNHGLRLGGELAELPALAALSLKDLPEHAAALVPWVRLTGLRDLALSTMAGGVPPALADLSELRALDLGRMVAPAWLRHSQLESLFCALSARQTRSRIFPASLRKLRLKLKGEQGGSWLNVLTSLENLQDLTVWGDLSGELMLPDALMTLPDLANLEVHVWGNDLSLSAT